MRVYGQIIVATIEPDPDSELSEYESAFLAIGQHGSEGDYHFSMGEGTPYAEMVKVCVQFPDRHKEPETVVSRAAKG